MNIKNKTTRATIRKLDNVTKSDCLTFGNMIWSIRMCDEISQTNFAKILGISSSHLCDIEHNRKTISPDLARKYAQILGYGEEQFVRLALQGLLDKAQINYNVMLEPQHKPRSLRL